jgi:hypothetical protein
MSSARNNGFCGVLTLILKKVFSSAGVRLALTRAQQCTFHSRGEFRVPVELY